MQMSVVDEHDLTGKFIAQFKFIAIQICPSLPSSAVARARFE